MSQKEVKRRNVARTVFIQAWKYFKRSKISSFSFALKLAWRAVRSMVRFHYSKVKGVSMGNRQALLKRLARYAPQDVFLSFLREPDNPFDPNAIQVVAEVRNKGQAAIGYVAKELAAIIAPILDSGNKEAVVLFNGIHSTTGINSFLGCNFCYAIL
ncbi:MAG: HIRAN domain-containing protein [Dehalobacterium sp.]